MYFPLFKLHQRSKRFAIHPQAIYSEVPQVCGVQNGQLAVTHDLTGSGSHGLQGFDSSLCFSLLEHAQNGIEQNDHQDDDNFGPFRLTGQHTGQSGNSSRHHKDDQHGILQLLDETLKQGRLFGFLELVGAILCQALFRLGRGKTLSSHAEVVQDFFCRQGVGFLMGFSSSVNCVIC